MNKPNTHWIKTAIAMAICCLVAGLEYERVPRSLWLGLVLEFLVIFVCFVCACWFISWKPLMSQKILPALEVMNKIVAFLLFLSLISPLMVTYVPTPYLDEIKINSILCSLLLFWCFREFLRSVRKAAHQGSK